MADLHEEDPGKPQIRLSQEGKPTPAGQLQQQVEELPQTYEELRAIYDGMFDGLMIWDRETWRIVRGNPSLCGMLGYSKSELLSLRIMDLHPKDEIPKILDIILARAEGRFQGVANVTLLRKDGSLSYVEVVSQPIACERRPCVATFFRDINKRRRAETALRESETRVRTICDSAMDAVVMADSEGKVLYWNPAAERMFGYAAEEMMGQEVHALLPAVRYREQARRAFSEFAVTGRARVAEKPLELTARRKDGSEFPIEISVSTFLLAEKWGAAAIIRDITERKKARDNLEHERLTLKRMLRASDHEFRLVAYDIHDGLAQQLAGAIMQFEAYRSLREKDPPRADALFDAGVAMLRRSHVEARRLISGLRPPILDEFGVVAAITHLVNDRQFENGPIIEFTKDVRFARLSPILENVIYRIVEEGLANAVKHSRSDRIRIRLFQAADRVHIEIRDWGIGFDRQEKREDQYGLDGIRERTRILNGRSTIVSEPGAGTTIFVELPLVQSEED
ncbi:MAG: PAS domain S-box protein [Pirellulales bacterium]|nr:PAS domain S-box protein [Pirellulales bacterium]